MISFMDGTKRELINLSLYCIKDSARIGLYLKLTNTERYVPCSADEQATVSASLGWGTRVIRSLVVVSRNPDIAEA